MTTSENLADPAGAPASQAWMLLIARVLLAPLFLFSGTGKLLAAKKSSRPRVELSGDGFSNHSASTSSASDVQCASG